MIPPALTDDKLKAVLDYAGFVPRRLRRDFLKTIARQLAGDADVSEPSAPPLEARRDRRIQKRIIPTVGAARSDREFRLRLKSN